VATLQDQLLNAIWSEDAAEVKKLLFAGASPNELDSKGWSPLLQAAEVQNAEIIKLLLAFGAKVNKKWDNGYTCLHLAVDSSIDGTIQNGGAPGDAPTEIIELLLVNGADVLAKNDAGETPLDWARHYKSEKVIRLLESKLQPAT
jgi:uncharacterized protein